MATGYNTLLKSLIILGIDLALQLVVLTGVGVNVSAQCSVKWDWKWNFSVHNTYYFLLSNENRIWNYQCGIFLVLQSFFYFHYLFVCLLKIKKDLCSSYQFGCGFFAVQCGISIFYPSTTTCYVIPTTLLLGCCSKV